MDNVTQACRRRWPAFQYAALVEFTTGYGPRSGGVRRPHFNNFVRGVPVDEEATFQSIVAETWCRKIDALPSLQNVYRVDEDRGGMRGLTRYVAHHFQKESQAPPRGWRGQRFRASRGYFLRSRCELRALARDSLQVGRDAFKGHATTREGWKVAHVRTPMRRDVRRESEVAGSPLSSLTLEGVGPSVCVPPIPSPAYA
jgi:hypothetical protein